MRFGGVLGGQVPRLYGGTIFGGVHLAQKFCFFDTFAEA